MTALALFILKLKSENKKPIFEVVKTCTDSEVYIEERKLIKKLTENGVYLLNSNSVIGKNNAMNLYLGGFTMDNANGLIKKYNSKQIKVNKINMKVKKVRKQKYPFKTIQVGETFKVKSAEYNSMLTAKRQHNKDFPELAIEITSEDLASNEMLITRVS